MARAKRSPIDEWRVAVEQTRCRSMLRPGLPLRPMNRLGPDQSVDALGSGRSVSIDSLDLPGVHTLPPLRQLRSGARLPRHGLLALLGNYLVST